MKLKICFIAAVTLLLAACRAHQPVAQQSGIDDVAYLLFVGQHDYAGKTVQVTIDDRSPFAAKVVKAKKANRRGTQYAITTGPRTLKVTCDGQTIYQKKIFVSTGEVKQIILP